MAMADMEVPDRWNFKDRMFTCSKCGNVYVELSGWRRLATRLLKVKSRCVLHRGRRQLY